MSETSITRSRKWLVVAVALPLVVLVVGIVRSEQHLASARRWQFAITCYDPRDHLRGHYLQYRLQLDEQPALETCEDDYSDRCCLCLHETEKGKPPVVRRASCRLAAERCDGRLQTRYLSELSRYYIPEARARELERTLQDAAQAGNARLVVAITESGKPQIDALLVAGQRIENTKSGQNAP